MSQKTNIEWATSTGNPWIGCTKVSPGCKNCYAATLDENRFSKTMGGGTKENPISHWGKGAPRFLTKAFWNDAKKWNRGPFSCDSCGYEFEQLKGRQKLCEPLPGDRCHRCNSGHYTRPRIFPSLCDWLDDEVPIKWLADFLQLIYATPNLDWLLLTKRPENWKSRLEAAIGVMHCDPMDFGDRIHEWILGNHYPQNVWIGASVENQKCADERIPQLLQIPSAVRFLSVEPLLEMVDLSKWTGYYPPHEINRHDRDVRLPGSEDRSSGNPIRRNDLENQGPSKKTNLQKSPPFIKISDSEIYDARKASEHSFAKAGISTFQGTDSFGFNSEPQGRDDDEQSSRQFRTSDMRSADRPRDQGSQETQNSQSDRRAEQHGDSKRESGTGNKTQANGGGESQSCSTSVRHNNSKRLQNSKGETVGISWIICGGESGPGRRDCGVEAIENVCQQVITAGVPLFVKQDCASKPGQKGRISDKYWAFKQFPK